MDAIEAGDCITFSDLAGTNLYANLLEVHKLLSIEVLPSLEEVGTDGQKRKTEICIQKLISDDDRSN